MTRNRTNNPAGRGAPGTTSRPRRTTPADLAGRLTCPVWSATEPNAAGLYDPPMGRDFAYRLAGSGDLPGVRRIGARYVVVVAEVLAALGVPVMPGQQDTAGQGTDLSRDPGDLSHPEADR